VRRRLMVLILLLATLFGTGSAAAHTMDVTAVLSLEEGRLSVQLLDPYGAPVAGGQVSAVVRPEGSRRGVRMALPEMAPGTYVGSLTSVRGTVAVQVDARLGADLYRVTIEGLPAEGGWSQIPWPMDMVELRPFPWGAVVYGLGLAVLGVAATVALVRRPAPAEQEGRDK